MAWLASVAPPARRGEFIGSAMGAAVGGALLGPVVGAVASHLGTGPAFSAAAVAGGLLMIAAFAVISTVIVLVLGHDLSLERVPSEQR